MKWKYVGAGRVVDADKVIVALDWGHAKTSAENRELVGYARAHGFLLEERSNPKTMLVMSDNVMLFSGSLKSIKRRLQQT